VIRFLLVCAGGAVGTGLRYLISGWTLSLTGPRFPFGTLVVNGVGSLVVSFVMAIALTTEAITPTARIVIATGVLGGFTTYSTFNYETLAYLQEGNLRLAAANVFVTVAACLAAGYAGFALAKLFR
jgi:fluoride exporter